MARRFTSPLVSDSDGLPVYSRGRHLVALVDAHTSLVLHKWQRELLVRVLEVCPPDHPRAGQLRFRQVVISIPRQTGKSVIASVLALFALLQHSPAPKVLGVARGAKQAAIVYGYASGYIQGSEALSGVLRARGTPSLGISRIDGPGSYVVLAGDADALQGYPSTLAIVDELHIVKEPVYDAIVTSQRAQTEALVVGITTAGDITSTLLKRLYAEGEKSIRGERDTFGFFCYEAESDELSIETITQANPSVQEGKLDAQAIYDEDVSTPSAHYRRYTLNRFVAGLAEPWVPREDWAACAGSGLEDFTDCVYTFDITKRRDYASITATNVIDGIAYTTLVARLVNPSQASLEQWGMRLAKAGRCVFAMNSNNLPSLQRFLEGKGKTVVHIYGSRMEEAAGMVYAAIKSHSVVHDNAGLVNAQHSTAKIKSSGERFVIVPNGSDADACYASVYGIYVALTRKKASIGIA